MALTIRGLVVPIHSIIELHDGLDAYERLPLDITRNMAGRAVANDDGGEQTSNHLSLVITSNYSARPRTCANLTRTHSRPAVCAGTLVSRSWHKSDSLRFSSPARELPSDSTQHTVFLVCTRTSTGHISIKRQE